MQGRCSVQSSSIEHHQSASGAGAQNLLKAEVMLELSDLVRPERAQKVTLLICDGESI